jgi:hypothetical protein
LAHFGNFTTQLPVWWCYKYGPVPFYKVDSNGEYYIVSGKSKRGGKSIEILLESSGVAHFQVIPASGEAACALAKWPSIRLAVGRNEISETAVNDCFMRLKAAWNKLLEALSHRDSSFCDLRAIPDGCNKALLCAKKQEAAMSNEATCAACGKDMATN